jgi:hypothetical protein
MDIFKEARRRSSIHLSKNEERYKNINWVISGILLIYCIIQLFYAFSDKEIPKELDIASNFIAVVLSSVGFFITWYSIKQSRKTAPYNR